MIHDRPRRLGTFSYTGLHRYHFRSATWNRAAHFREAATVAGVREHLFQLSEAHGVSLLAYCFMPDHAHVLVEGRSHATRPLEFMTRWKQQTGYHFQRVRHQRLWQPGFFDRVLRERESSRVVAQYILANPVRAGIVKTPSEYPYSYCAWLEDWSEEAGSQG